MSHPSSDESLSPTSPLGDAIDTFLRREDADRFIARVKRDDPQLAAHLRVVERELEAGGRNRAGQDRGPARRTDTPVVSILLAFRGLARAMVAVWRDPETKALPFVAGALVLTGTIFYWRFEDWTLIQSLYFAVVTLTTVGYGDLTPTSDETRIFTIIYILTGLGVLVALLSSVAQHYIGLKTGGGHSHGHPSLRRHGEQPEDGAPTEPE